MKLRTLIKRAQEIIQEEYANVFAEFHEDDGSITPENYASAMVLKRRYEMWLKDSHRALGNERPKTRSARRRKAQVARKIVVQK